MMSSRRETIAFFACGTIIVCTVGIWLTLLMPMIMIQYNPSGQHYGSNGTQTRPLFSCPSKRFLSSQGYSIQIIENENIPYSPRCFNLPQRTYSHRSNCYQTTKEECTPLTATLKCYHPGECPKYHTRHSIFLNTHNTRIGQIITSQAVCCH